MTPSGEQQDGRRRSCGLDHGCHGTPIHVRHAEIGDHRGKRLGARVGSQKFVDAGLSADGRVDLMAVGFENVALWRCDMP